MKTRTKKQRRRKVKPSGIAVICLECRHEESISAGAFYGAARPHCSKCGAPVDKARRAPAPKRQPGKKHKRMRTPYAVGQPCSRCGHYETLQRVVTSSNGTEHIRLDCASCGKYLKFLPHADVQRVE